MKSTRLLSPLWGEYLSCLVAKCTCTSQVCHLSLRHCTHVRGGHEEACALLQPVWPGHVPPSTAQSPLAACKSLRDPAQHCRLSRPLFRSLAPNAMWGAAGALVEYLLHKYGQAHASSWCPRVAVSMQTICR